MKVQEGDYVDTSGMNKTERRDVVQALLDCGVPRGEGFNHVYCSWNAIGFGNGGVCCEDYTEYLSGRKLTLSDLRHTEWNGEGLPSAGTVCEYASEDDHSEMDVYRKGESRILGTWVDGDYLSVIAVANIDGTDCPVVQNNRTDSVSSITMKYIRPIKTKEKREREDLYALVERTYGNCHCDSTVSGVSQYITDALIKAGYKRDSK